MNVARLQDIQAGFEFRLSEILRIAEADGREEAMVAVQQVLAERRDVLPDGEGWREVTGLQERFRSTKFLQEIPRGRDR